MEDSIRECVVGAGPVGRAVVAEVVRAGRKSLVISRSPRELPAGARQVVAGAGDPEALAALPHGATIYHCANAPYDRWPQELPGLWDSVLRLAEARSATLVVATNLYSLGSPASGTQGSGELTEDSPMNPCSRKGEIRRRVEESVLESIASGRIRGAIVRASDFYGPGVVDSALGSRFFPPLLEGKPAQFLGSLDAPHSYTYVPDFARTLVAAADAAAGGAAGKASRRQWIVPNAPPVSLRQVLEILSDLTGRPVRPSLVSKGMLRLVGIFSPPAREMVEMLYEFTEPFVANGRTARAELGVEPTDFRTGIAATLDWFRARSEARGGAS